MKFISGLWVRFDEFPQKALHKRFNLSAWVSTLHWNGSQYNSGDTEDSKIGKARSASLRAELTEDEQRLFEQKFNLIVVTAREKCVPRMQLKENKKRSAAELLRTRIEKQISGEIK